LPDRGNEKRGDRLTRTIRATAWSVIIALAVFQAWANRFAVGPDGISYLDLSDGITTGHWFRLVNLYWSPLYPALVGVGRLVTRANPANEIAVMHAVNVACLIAMLAGFEYMLMSIMELAARTRGSALAGPWGLPAAYALFASFVFTMNPMELTTPDLLSGASVFAAFGAMLRVRSTGLPDRRSAVVLGASLGLGALAKSFMVPWAIVCFVTIAITLKRRGVSALIVAVAVWGAFVLPWSAVLSREAGRVTFGDAGRLTYGWYVNGEDTPSVGGVPSGARTASTEMILPGVAATGDTVGTDPMWFNPAKWNTTLRPHFDLGKQLEMLRIFERFYLGNLTPLLFLFFLIPTAPRGTRRASWRKGYVVYLPAVAGMVAYAMVVVTARYIMPFELAGTLTLLATLPISRRLRPLMVLIGTMLPVALEAFDPQTVLAFSFVVAVIAGLVVGVLTTMRSRFAWCAVVLVAFVLARLVFSARLPVLLATGAAANVLVLWGLSARAVHARQTVRFAHGTYYALLLTLGATMALRVGLRISQDFSAMGRASTEGAGNVPLRIANEFAAHGVGPGTRIALIGPHAESYWARTGRMHIVANVPRTRVAAFWELSRGGQDSLLTVFAKAGATVAVASLTPPGGPGDPRWIPLKFNGWMRVLER
jgi:hypothetical protein